MKFQVEDITQIKKKISFEIPEERYKKALEAAYQKLKKNVQIKGFRKGKVPQAILEKYYGAKTSMDTVNDLLDESYREAIQKDGIKAVGMPKIDDLKVEDNSPITFTAEVEVQPQIETKSYEGIKLKKIIPEVKDEEMEAELKALQKAHVQWIPLEGEAIAEKGHAVSVDFEGTLDGTPFEGGSGKNAQIQLGEGRFLPEFENGILGAKVGEVRDVDVSFPPDYGTQNLQGKKAVFKITVHSIKREELPELDDEFAKDLGNFESFEQIKNQLKDRMLKQKESQEKGNLFQQILEHLIKKNSFDLPQAMIEREVDYMWRTTLNQLAQQKVNPESIGINETEYKSKNRDEAIKRIKSYLLFDSIAKQNNLEVKEEEIDAKLGEIAQSYKQPVDVIKKYYQEQGLTGQLYSQILEEKTMDLILSKAKISEKKK